jgi:hypothetical protein
MSYACHFAVFLNWSRVLKKLCIRMTAGLSLKRSGNQQAVVSARAVSDVPTDGTQFKPLPTDLLF